MAIFLGFSSWLSLFYRSSIFTRSWLHYIDISLNLDSQSLRQIFLFKLSVLEWAISYDLIRSTFSMTFTTASPHQEFEKQRISYLTFTKSRAKIKWMINIRPDWDLQTQYHGTGECRHNQASTLPSSHQYSSRPALHWNRTHLCNALTWLIQWTRPSRLPELEDSCRAPSLRPYPHNT